MDGIRDDELLDKMSKITGRKPAPPPPSAPRIAPTKNPYDDIFDTMGKKHGVDPDLLRAMSNQESAFRPNARSFKGASGLMQLMPATAQRFGVTDIYDPQQNIEGGAKYMRFLLDRYNGDVERALVGYNAGEGNADRNDWRERSKGWSNSPTKVGQSTFDYMQRIRSNYRGAGYRRTSVADTSGADDLLAEMRKFSGGGGVASVPDAPEASNLLAEMQKVTGQTSNLPPVNPQNAPVEMIVPQPDQPPAPKTIFDKQGNPVQAIGGLDPNQPADQPTAPPVDQNQQLEAYRNYSKNELAAGRQPRTFADFTASTETQNPVLPSPSPSQSETSQNTAVPPPVEPQNAQNPPRPSQSKLLQNPAPPKTVASPSAPVLSEADTLAVLKYKGLKDTPENRALVDREARQNANFGRSVEAQGQVIGPSVRQTAPPPPVDIPDSAYRLEANTSNRMGVVKTADDILKTQAGVVSVDLAQKPKGMRTSEYLLRAAYKALQPKYGYSNEAIDNFVRNRPRLTDDDAYWDQFTDQNLPQTIEEWRKKGDTSVIRFTMNRNGIANLFGGTDSGIPQKVLDDYKEEQRQADEEAAMRRAMERGKGEYNFTTDSLQRGDSPLERTLRGPGETPVLPTKTIDEGNGIKRTVVDDEKVRQMAVSDLTRESLGFFGSNREPTEEEIQKRVDDIKARGLNPQQASVAGEYGENLKKNYGLFGTAFGGFLGGAARNLDWLNGLGKIVQWGSGKEDSEFAKWGSNLMTRISNAGKVVDEAAKYKDETGASTFGSEFVSMLGATPADLSRLGLQTMLPGGEFVAFPLDSMMTSVGRGETPETVFKETLKGGAMGLLFHGAGVIGENAKAGLLDAALGKAEAQALADGTATLSRKADAALYLYGRGATLATITFGTTGLNLVEGRDLKESALGGLQMGLFDGLMKSKADAANLVGKILKATDGKETVAFTVIPKGDSGDYEVVRLNEMPETADAIVSSQKFPKKTVDYNDDGTVKTESPVETVSSQPETLEGKTVTDRDGRRGLVKTDSGATKGVIVEWEDGKTSQINRKKLTVAGAGERETGGTGEGETASPDATPVSSIETAAPERPQSDFDKTRAVSTDESGNLSLKTIETKVPEEAANGGENMQKNMQTAPDSESLLGKTIEREDGRRGKVVGENENTKTVQVEWEDGSFGGAPRRTVSVIEPDVQAAPEPVQTQPVKAPETQENKPIQPVQAPVEMFKKIDSLAQMPKAERQAALKQMKSDYDGSGFERARRINGNIAEIVRRMEEKGVLEKICD